MKKLTKKSLDELAKVMPVVSEKSQQTFLGGTGSLLGSLWNATADGTNATYTNTGSGSFTDGSGMYNYGSGDTLGDNFYYDSGSGSGNFDGLVNDATRVAPGGITNTLRIADGTLKLENGSTVFYGNDGTVVRFDGVSWTTATVRSDTAYCDGNAIHIDQGWANNGFKVENFAHEYGHYIQRTRMSAAGYWSNALLSAGSVLVDGVLHTNLHDSLEYEEEATQLGTEYLKTHKEP